MEFYDAHVHFLWDGSFEHAPRSWEGLRNLGLRGMAVIIMGHHLADPARCLDLIPTAYHPMVDTTFFEKPPQPDTCVPGPLHGMPLFPYLDSRYMEEAQADLTPFRKAGFRGLKVLFIPEEDRDSGMVGWERLFGRTMAASEDLTSRLVAQAAEFGWPVIFHADLRRYGRFVEGLLKAHADTPFILPHFGFSRKEMAGLLERLDHVYTDFSSLLPFMRQAPEAYAAFIGAYPDRILFGTDAIVGSPEFTGEYMSFAAGMIRDEEIQRKVFMENYLRIHGSGYA